MTDSPPTTVHCRAIDGTRHTLRLTVIGETTITGALRSRSVSVESGPVLLQKWVQRTTSGRPGPLGPLDCEIRATHRFAQMFPPDDYPCELPRLRYYDVDSEDPFVLLDPYRGVPATEVVSRLTAHERCRLQVGLLRALHLIAAAGIAHGRVGLDVVRWDATTASAQLVDFEQAMPVELHNDVRDAGLAIWRTAQPAHRGKEAPEVAAGDGTLGSLLAGVFVDPPAAPPLPGELLARLREPTEIHAVDARARLAPDFHAFEAAVWRKRERRQEDEERRKRAGGRWPRLRSLVKRPTSPARHDNDESPALARCPMCLDSYPLPDNGLWRRDNQGRYHEIPAAGQDGLKRGLDLVNTYRRCPNPSQDATEHFLPANYFAHDPPLVVAMIGRPGAGKTHLLAAMVRGIVEHNGLTPYGLTAVPMDLHRHDAYRTSFLEPVGRGLRLPETPERLTDPAEILLIRGRNSTRPLVLFDVAGEDLQAVGDGELARFLVGADAMIFVHGVDPLPEGRGDQALEMSLARLQAVPDLGRLPAAIVATKSDRLRYQAPVDSWMRSERDSFVPVDPKQSHLESGDVYAFLHHRQEYGALAPFTVFDRCTLHFVSASGSESAPDKQEFPRGFHPSRALQPLVAILAMTGVLEGPELRHIGT
ncbi:ATP-binding protein [Actinokineospora pegani]|uniref:ATP-binding protein n=1 Tax=Actinokineospora pegani TaxID=2654637 RepID=UPI0012EABF6C|nr:ATP-binding protein [Actinokineospora pegani]